MSQKGNKVPPENEDRVVMSTTRARQGVTGHNVRYILLAGTTGIIVLFIVVYIVFFT